jgi:hypothetical protein
MDVEIEMGDEPKSGHKITEEDRRRFLKFAKNLGTAGVITVALARPDYAAASGFGGSNDQGENNNDQGENEQ